MAFFFLDSRRSLPLAVTRPGALASAGFRNGSASSYGRGVVSALDAVSVALVGGCRFIRLISKLFRMVLLDGGELKLLA